MDRFNELPNNTKHLADVYGDAIADSRCDHCRDFFVLTNLVIVHEQDEKLPTFLCPECAAKRVERLLELDAEPPCTCAQTDVDLFDARGCEAHDTNSGFNVRLRNEDVTYHISPLEVA